MPGSIHWQAGGSGKLIAVFQNIQEGSRRRGANGVCPILDLKVKLKNQKHTQGQEKTDVLE